MVVEVPRPGLLDRIVDYLLKQDSKTVLLFCILGAVGYGAWFGVPAAIGAINAGYRENLVEFKQMLRDEREQNQKWHTELVERLEKAMDQRAVGSRKQ